MGVVLGMPHAVMWDCRSDVVKTFVSNNKTKNLRTKTKTETLAHKTKTEILTLKTKTKTLLTKTNIKTETLTTKTKTETSTFKTMILKEWPFLRPWSSLSQSKVPKLQRNALRKHLSGLFWQLISQTFIRFILTVELMNLMSGQSGKHRRCSAWLRYDSFAAKCVALVIFLQNLKLFKSEEILKNTRLCRVLLN